MKRWKIAGHCPACGAETLAANPSGTIVCCAELCPRPTALAEILAPADTAHVVEIQPDDFTLRHPLIERLDGALFDCQLHAAIAASDGPPVEPGRYLVDVHDHRTRFTPFPTTSTTSEELHA